MMRVSKGWAIGLVGAGLVLAPMPRPCAAEPDPVAERSKAFSELSIEELLQVKITSVTGIAASFFGSPAAVTVISGEDLRRHGFQSIAEAFRMVPGMQVARVDSHGWAISVRGFNSGFAEKLLVLIDGRVVYDPRFTGVFWDIQDVLLDDVSRIEVIRGPGATLWGANAVSGVVNITTKGAQETHGTYVNAGAGTEERAFVSARQGGRIGSRLHYRVWGKYFDRDNLVDADTGRERTDDWSLAHGGARFDLETSGRTTLTLDTHLYGSDHIGTEAGVAVPGHLTFRTVSEDVTAHGGHALLRLSDGPNEDAGWNVQAYYAREERGSVTLIGSQSNTYDLDVRHHFEVGRRHKLLVGAGLRRIEDQTRPGMVFAFDPAARDLMTYSGFVQDTIDLADVSLMIGSKFERNDFTGFEYQPSVRLAFTPDDRQTLWGAVSRPIRTPARAGQDFDVTITYVDLGLIQQRPPAGIYVPVKLLGNRELQSEQLTAYELGYRRKIGEHLSVDLAVYRNDFRDLVSTPLNEFGKLGNLTSADGYGLELAATYRPSARLGLDAAYTYTRLDVDAANVQLLLRDVPHMANLRAHLAVTPKLRLDGGLYFTDAPLNTPAVDSYVRADLGASWSPVPALELSVWGQNLLQDRHPEFPPIFPAPLTAVRRGAYAQLTFRK